MSTSYTANLFDRLMAAQGFKNDAALSRALEVAPPVISKHRGGTLPLGPTMILRIHEKFGMPVQEIRDALAGY